MVFVLYYLYTHGELTVSRRTGGVLLLHVRCVREGTKKEGSNKIVTIWSYLARLSSVGVRWAGLLVDKKWGGKYFVRLARVELLDLGLDLKWWVEVDCSYFIGLFREMNREGRRGNSFRLDGEVIGRENGIRVTRMGGGERLGDGCLFTQKGDCVDCEMGWRQSAFKAVSLLVGDRIISSSPLGCRIGTVVE